MDGLNNASAMVLVGLGKFEYKNIYNEVAKQSRAKIPLYYKIQVKPTQGHQKTRFSPVFVSIKLLRSLEYAGRG